VTDNMHRELAQTLKQRRRTAILDQLAASNPLELPQLLVEQAIRELQIDMLRRMGAKDAKTLPPRDPFVEPARKRVQIGLLMTELVNSARIQIDAAAIDAKIAEAVAQTPNPEEAEKQYRGNQQAMQQVQVAALEEAALEWVAVRANITPQPATFREVMNFGAEA
jgi:trigger factor